MGVLFQTLIFLFPLLIPAIVDPMEWRQKLFIWGMLLSLLVLWVPQTTTAQDPASEIIQLVNGVRTSFGLAPFQYSPALAIAAQSHANWMGSTAVYSHTGAGGSTPQTRADSAGYAGYVSENIVGGTSLTPQQGVTWWRNSAVHFNTMVSTRYTQIGAGYAVGHGQNFYVIVVGNPSERPVQRAAQVNPAPVAVAPIVLSQPSEDGSIVHEVLTGQTFWAIAARYEVSLDNLFLFNNLNENSILSPGDKLTIRLAEGQEPPPTPTPPPFHVVQDGDTAWTIAAWYNISLSDLLWFNNLSEDDFLQPGDEVIIRLEEGQLPPPTPTPLTNHIVEQGQSLWGIAGRYRISLADLLAWNNLGENPILQPGDELRILPPPTATPIPTATESPVATATTAVLPTVIALEEVETTVTEAAVPAQVLAQNPQPTATLPLTATAASAAPSFLTIGIIVFALGLTALAGVVLMILRQNS